MCGKETPFSLEINSSTDPEIKQLKDKLATYYNPEELQKVLTYGQYIAPGSPSTPVNLNSIIRGKSNVPADVQEAYSKLLEKGTQLSGLETTTDKQGNPVFKFVSPTEKNATGNKQLFQNQQNLEQQRLNNWNNRVVNNESVPTSINPTVDNTQPTPKGTVNLPKVQFPNMQSSNLEPLDDNRNASLRDFNPFGIPQITPQVPNTIATNKTTYPITLPNSPLNPNYKPPVNSGFSMTNPYDSNSSYAGDWLNKFKERERNNNPELSQDEIDRITAEDNALNNIIDSNYGFNSSSIPKVNENISNNQLANLPNQNQWSNLQEPLSVQRPYEYADPQQAIIGSIKTDFKPADSAIATLEKTKDEIDSTKGFNYKRAARLGAFNTGLNLVGNMYNMSRMNKQENLNSFITQQPEAVYPNKRMLYGDKSMFAEMGGEYSYGGMYPDGGSVYNPDAYVGQLVQYKKGGIYIKPENKGKFTEWASSHGMSVQEAASHVMANKEKYSSTTVKRANFAKNASKWKHEDGGEYAVGGPIKPIFTSDRNDPRLRSYNDSLGLYNLSNIFIKKGQEHMFNLDRLQKANISDDESVKLFRKRWTDAYDDLINFKDKTITPNDPNEPYTAYDFNVGKDKNNRGIIDNSGLGTIQDKTYKKPVQPIIYKKKEPKVFTEIPTPLNPNYKPKESFMTTSYRNMINNTLPEVKEQSTGPVKWFALGNTTSVDPAGKDKILMDNKFLTRDEFEKYKKDNPNFRYAQKPDSTGRRYNLGGGIQLSNRMYEEGGEYELSQEEIQDLKNQGYDIELL